MQIFATSHICRLRVSACWDYIVLPVRKNTKMIHLRSLGSGEMVRKVCDHSRNFSARYFAQYPLALAQL